MHHALRIAAGLTLIVTLAGCISAEKRVLRGDDLYVHGDYEGALHEYSTARRKDPTIPGMDRKIHDTQVRLFMQRGDDAVAQRRFTDADRLYEEVRRLEPDNRELDTRFQRLAEARADWHFERGEKYLASGDPFGAIPEFEQALSIVPGHARARAALERAEREQGERRARAETLYAEGLTASDAQQFARALELFDRVLTLDPTHPGAALERDHARQKVVEDLVERGDAVAAQGDWAGALDLYEQARSHDPSSRTVRARAGHARREVEAEQWITRGDDAAQLGEWRRAFESYEHARLLTAEPERSAARLREARDALASVLEAKARTAEDGGRYEEALSRYREILEIHPGHATADEQYRSLAARIDTAGTAYRAGCVTQRRGDLLAARQAFRECVEALAGYLDAAKRLDDVRSDVAVAESLYDRARAADAAGENERARVLYEECLAIANPFRDAYERLEEARADRLHDRDSYSLYDDACRAQSLRNYEQARTLFLECEAQRPAYRDVPHRLDAVQAALDRAAAAYRNAAEAEQRHLLAEARDAYGECLAISSTYRDAADRLDDVETTLKLLREASRLERERRPVEALECHRKVLARHPGHPHAAKRVRELEETLATLKTEYTRLVDAQSEGDYRVALGLAVEIRRGSRGYEDIDVRIKRLELEADYADARTFEESGRVELARQAYDRCVQRDPGFRDAQQRLARLRGDGGRDRSRGPGSAQSQAPTRDDR